MKRSTEPPPMLGFVLQGGFAHCYKVICADTKRAYAMKIVPKSTLTKSRARQKVRDEEQDHGQENRKHQAHDGCDAQHYCSVLYRTVLYDCTAVAILAYTNCVASSVVHGVRFHPRLVQWKDRLHSSFSLASLLLPS